MNCRVCNTSNQEGANFCQNCGEGLNDFSPIYNPEKKGSKALLLAFIIISWECLVSVIWLILSKIIIPGFKVPFDSISNIYSVAGNIVTFLTVTLLIVFAIIVNNNTARTFFIIFAVIHVIVFFAYRIPVVTVN